MQDRSHRRGIPWATLLIFALVAACDEPEPGNAAIAAPVAEAPPAPVPTQSSLPKPGADRVERGIATPPPPPADPPGDFSTEGVTRNFTDPPLPPELLDDGGLKPLPTSRP